MSDDDLTPKEAAMLVLLLAENRALTNTDLKETHGFELPKANRDKLNRLGYVESTKDGRKPFVHHLTDAGWARCYQPLNLESPKARAQGAALAALHQAVLRHLERAELSLADFASTAATAAEQPDDQSTADGAGRHDYATDDAGSSAGTGTGLGSRIRQAYQRLASRRGAYVGFVELRAELADIERRQLDTALAELEREPDVTILPESNQKTLTAADREAALWIGGEHKHFLSIGA